MSAGQKWFLTILTIAALIIAGAFIWQTARLSDTTPDTTTMQLQTI
jgi:cell division protein FtsL